MPKKICGKPKQISYLKYLKNRELGFKNGLGHTDDHTRKIFTSFNSYSGKDHKENGGIFNLEFSLDGSILAAACEKKSIVLYDAINQKKVCDVQEAHSSCVNCIKFLDHFAFASGSDDSIIKLWDMRFLKSCTRTLKGHSNWVKNIEFSNKENRLLTSSFDGGIFSWDLNNYTENNVIYDKVFVMDGLMRTKLTPDGSKLVICTTSGYLIIIHDVNLQTLCNDLRLFKPNLYRLMQLSEQSLPVAAKLNHLFSPHRKENRVELVSDFPNDAEVISSLQIHPMGWCSLSRNISGDENSEWTCVHDIQERDKEEYLNSYMLVEHSPEPTVCLDANSPVTTDIWMGFVSNYNFRIQRTVLNPGDMARPSVRLYNSGLMSYSSEDQNPTEGSLDSESTADSCKIIQNLPRLTHYMIEPNVGKGFIKELCFSADGRIICSPYYEGIRFFSFNKYCNELSNCVPEKMQKLHELTTFKETHPQIVVSCKFNPYHSILVSGCLAGKIIWYQPVF